MMERLQISSFIQMDFAATLLCKWLSMIIPLFEIHLAVC